VERDGAVDRDPRARARAPRCDGARRPCVARDATRPARRCRSVTRPLEHQL